MFESGAGRLHLARKSEKLMPRDAVGEAETVQWIIAALNSIEMVTVHWWFLEISGAKRSEERRVGKECVSTCSYRWSRDHEKKQTTERHDRSIHEIQNKQ